MARRDSNSSMTERTFRSPSPGRRGDYDSVPSAPDAPPVPTIPKTVPKGQRRSASVEPTSLRVTSPTPKRGGRNASLDRINLGGAGRGGASSAATIAASSAAFAKPRELEREDSQRSVNFSRPMSPGPSAPPARPASAAGYFTTPKGGPASPRTTAGARPQSSLAMSAMQARKVEQDIQNAANKPVLKKKKKAVAANEGDRLANGTMHPGPTGTAVNTPASPATTVQSAPQSTVSEVTPVKKKKKRVVIPVETEATTEPPPKNPARFFPSRDGATSPTSPRAAGMLQKQPSMVREEPEAEYMAEKETTLAKTRSPARAVSMQAPRRVISTSEGPARAYVAPSGQRAASLDIPRDTTSRSASLSPSRNHAHFSDVLANTPANKHQPPPRSVSPFKSALKHSPASSVRGTSPGALANGTKPPPSDASDTTSLASQDGVKPAKKKKKKSARVSFDDGGTTVSEPVLAAMPNTSKTIRRELSPVAAMDSDVDEVMTPRPALPAFGSVRGRKSQSQSPEPAEKVTQTVPSSTPATAATTSDHALGALVANDFADKEKQRQSPAVPPQVTSVEGSGYASDSSAYSQESMPANKDMDNLTSETATTEPPAMEHKEFVGPEEVAEEAASEPAAIEPSTATRSADDMIARVLSAPVVSASGEEITPAATLSLPNISVQPATPGLDEEEPILEKAPSALSNNGYSRYSIPGGWEESEASKSDSTTSQRPQAIEMEEPELDSSEDEDDEGDEDTLEAPGVAADRHSPNLEPIYESDSDDSAAFSDAPEDPPEFDGGFASLDAIVESPASRHSAGRALSTPPDSPSSRLPPPRMPFPQTSPLASNSPITAATPDDGDWSKATSYWSSLTREKREAMERQAQATTDSDPPVLQQPKSKKRTQATSPVLVPVAEPVTQILEPPAEPRSVSKEPEPRAPVLKKSMRSPAPAPAPVPSSPVNGDTHLRKSMRPVSGGGMKTSMRPEQAGGGMKTSMRGEHTPRSSVDNEPRGGPQQKRVPSAPSAGSLGAAATAVKKSTPAVTAKPSTAPAPADDSDSESSFRKKKRRGSVSTVDSAGRYNMKRSMRGSSVDMTAERRPLSPTPAPRGSGGLSVRSLSPNGSFMGRNKGESIRASLRGDPVDNTPTMRGKNSKAMRDSKSPTRFSMSGFSKPPRQASSSVPPPKTGGRSSGMFKSRFADSDDEDEPSSRMGFRSRFVDSDEEDSPVGPPRQMPSNLPPVRGIPRSQNRYADDSTDLEDSEDEGATRSSRMKNASRPTSSKKPVVPSQSDIDAAMAAARRNVAAMNGGREPGVVPEADQQLKKQVTLDSEPQTNGVNGALPPTTPTKRKGIFGSMLGRRRTSSVASVPQIPSTYYAPSAPSSPAPKSEMIASPQGKLQRKTTKRMNSTMSSMSAAPISQTRDDANPPGSASTNSQNWPLPSSSEGDRPLTSDGADAAHLRRTMRGGGGLGPVTRPEIKRRSMSSGDIDRMTTKAAVYSEKTGKKKRFGLLRRAFGLND